MSELIEVLKICVPAGIVLYGMYLVVRSMLNKLTEVELIKKNVETQDDLLNKRLQAYERYCLFLERISMENLLLQNSGQNLNVYGLQEQLIAQIREEFYHNIAQQIYIDDEIWQMVKKSKEDAIATVYQYAQTFEDKEKTHGNELSTKMLSEILSSEEQQTTHLTIQLIKQKVRTLF